MSKAEFLIIGAQKCGTTAVHDYLSRHPDLMAPQKEIRFFNSSKKYALGENFYHSHFAYKNSGRNVFFDTSPGYLVNKESPERIYKYNRDVKLIALLRNPIHRAFSAWNMYRGYFNNNENWFEDWVRTHEFSGSLIKRNIRKFHDFSFAIEEELNFISKYKNTGYMMEAPILDHGRYWENIKRFYQYFHESQLLVIDSRQVRQNTVGTLKSIEEFVGISPHDWRAENLKPVFEGDYNGTQMQDRSWQVLREYYAEDMASIEKKFGICFDEEYVESKTSDDGFFSKVYGLIAKVI